MSISMDDLNNPKMRKKVMKAIMHQMKNIGFLTIDNNESFNEAELLKAIKAFHRLPQKTKHSLSPHHLNKKNKNLIHGYFPFFPNDPSHKEFLDYARNLKDISKKE